MVGGCVVGGCEVERCVVGRRQQQIHDDSQLLRRVVL